MICTKNDTLFGLHIVETGVKKVKKITAFLLAFLITLQLPFGAFTPIILVEAEAACSAEIDLPQTDSNILKGLSGGEKLRVLYTDKNASETKKYTYNAAASLQLSKCGNKYGYNDLAKRSNGEQRQQLYNDMLASAVAFYADTSDVANIISVSETGYYFADSFDFSENGLTKDEALETWIVFRNDNPVYYWISNTAVLTDNMIYLTVADEYRLGSERTRLNAILENALKEYSDLTKDMSTKLEKALAVHDKICADTEYAKDIYENPSSEVWAHNVMGVFDNKKAVCEGYAKAYQIILTYIGIENVYVTGVSSSGTGSENHAWNMVKLDDNEWHSVDVTWDDTTVSEGYTYLYFALGAGKFNTSHTANTPTNARLNFLYELPTASTVTYTPVKLVKGTNTALCKSITEALSLINDATADYEIRLFKYTNTYTIEADELPSAKSISFKGNFYDRSEQESGSFYVDEIYLKNDTKLKCNVNFENIDIKFDNENKTSVTVAVGESTLSLSGKFCRMYAHIIGTTNSILDMSKCTSVHFYGNINVNEATISTGSCSFFGSEYIANTLTVSSGTTDVREGMTTGFSNVKTINIPASVNMISSSAFYNNKKLTEIKVDAGNTYYSSSDGVLYKLSTEGKPEQLTAYPAAKSGDVFRVPYSVKLIGDYAFANANGLKQIYAYKNVNSIGNNAFVGTDSLEKVYISSAVEAISANAFTSGTSTAIYGKKNSCAEAYATENEISFVETNEYTYKFLNYDESELAEEYGFANEKIILPATPTRPQSQHITYTFKGWDGYNDGMLLTGDMTFKALYDENVKQYTYRFFDADGKVIKEVTAQAGTQIVPPEDDPTKLSTAQYTYKFLQWIGFTSGMTLSDNIDFTPSFKETVREYTYTFYKEDRTTVIKTEKVPYGTTIVCPADEFKPANGTVKYVFKGWENYTSGMTVSKNIDFYAEFTETANTFTYIFYDEDGETVLKSLTALYGTEIICPTEPTKEADEITYTFTGWTGYKYGMKLTEDITFKASYGIFDTPCRYVFYNDDGSIFSVVVCEKGSAVVLPEEPTKADTEKYHWSFKSWSGYTEGMTVEQDMSFTAVYESSLREYKYTFYEDDRETVIKEGVAKYGSTITAPEHTKQSTAEYTYELIGWENYTDGMTLSGEICFYAQYKATKNKYTYKFVDYDGTLISEATEDYGTIIITPEPPERTGHLFKRWIGYTANMQLKDDVTFVAQYEVNETGIISSIYETDAEGLYLTGVAPQTTYVQFLRNIENTLTVKLFTADGTELTDMENVIGSGTTVKLIADNGAVLQQLIVVVKGDTNGDGTISITDFIQVKKHLLSNGEFLSDVALAAADYNSDGGVTITDFIQIKAYLLNA